MLAAVDRILAHLTESLSIDREDFDEAPVLARGRMEGKFYQGSALRLAN